MPTHSCGRRGAWTVVQRTKDLQLFNIGYLTIRTKWQIRHVVTLLKTMVIAPSDEQGIPVVEKFIDAILNTPFNES